MDKQELPKTKPNHIGTLIGIPSIGETWSCPNNCPACLYERLEAALKQLEEARQENIGHLAAIAELKKKIASDQRYHESINQALNSGNGVYKP